jgi:hypothetical protein
MVKRFRSKFIFAACLVGALCSSELARTNKMTNIPEGTWGALHIRIEVEKGSATIDYDCAHGTIDGPLTVDSQGRFSLSGTHVREHGGPIREDEKLNSEPAQYTGSVADEKMNLTVTLRDTKETVGTFTLEHGKPGRVFKCK